MTLVETGTRALLGAVFGPTAEGATSYASRLLHLLRPDMLVLWDKGFDGNDFLASVTATRAQFPGRLRSNRRTPVLTCLADGSYLSVIAAEKVRVIDTNITVTCADGTVFTGSYRLVTTLTDAGRYPAAVLVGLYHQRWEHESAYYALRHTIMNGRVLRSRDPAGVEQEMWALFTLYQALRTMMVEAAESLPGTDPDRCCFTIALQTARDQVVQAAAVITDPADAGRVGLIGHRILARLLPPRRQRVSTRKVKSPMSRYSTAMTTASPTPAAPSPVSASASSNLANHTPNSPPSPATTGTPPTPTAAATGSLASSRKTPPASGAPATSPPTSATSPWRPCTDSSPDGPRVASSTNWARASTPPQHGPQQALHDLRKR
ncbi:transposase [Streptomyces microflavus]|uniref:Transposase n=1 Tax=Streptomyces microflavus TaxID=1919 RepID=A0A7H8MY86_STRMI|nr:transposase [Streptomyces microflavus]QKW47124.1 transposase [Streptomyces microflavus]